MSPDDLNLSVRAPGEAPSEPPTPWGRRLRKWARDLGVSAVLVSGLWVGLGMIRAPSLPASPTFVLQNLEGQPVDLASFRGAPVLVNFWATWCPPCRMEMPELVHYAETHPDVPVLFVAVDGKADDLRTFAQAHGLRLDRVLLADKATKAAWPVTTLPTTVGIAPDGSVRGAHAGIVLLPQLWWWGR